jgi:hypothetical protein
MGRGAFKTEQKGAQTNIAYGAILVWRGTRTMQESKNSTPAYDVLILKFKN